MSDSDDSSIDADHNEEMVVQPVVLAESDDEDSQQHIETAQVLEPEEEEDQKKAKAASRHLSYDDDDSADLPYKYDKQDKKKAKSADQKKKAHRAAKAEEVKDENDEEEEGVVAAVVLEDDDEDENMEDVAQAEVVDDDTHDDHAIAVALAEEEESSKPKKKKSRKKAKKKTSKRNRAHQGGVPPERLDAAAQAREVLLDTVSRLPVQVSDSYVVRSFGRLQVQDSLESPFCSASALFPVGFSCDRYEFSPVHGRVMKLRCTILDGSKIDGSSGPIFRVMWGQGVDDDTETMDYPYDPYTASAPIASGDQVDAVALPLADEGSSPTVLPEVGMRVKVRFEEDQWYGGTIVHVGDEDEEQTTKRDHVEICIQYDDGSTEDASFPDPDISLTLPGDDDDTEKGVVDLTELRGKPVTSVSGTTPLEAWGKALVKLGLIDEIIFDSAMEALTSSREEGRAEAMGKLQAQKLQRQQARLKSSQKHTGDEESDEKAALESSPKSQVTSQAASPTPSSVADDVDADAVPHDGQEVGEEGKEEATEKEQELRARVDKLREELEGLQDQDREALIALTDARISQMGPFLCNPFRENDPTYGQQSAWLATVIRKEKAKMGSTGNKKKVVTRTDLLERNDTFYSSEIERLLEGLPGSEYCPSYVFQEFRSGGAAAINQAWIHEAEIRHEKEREKKLKSAKEAKFRASQQREREMKKRKREEDRDARKRQKMEEAEQKRRARAEERMSRLSVQVDERLFKEACFQREKVVAVFVKALSKEFARRRKAAEVVSGNAVLTTRTKTEIQRDQQVDGTNGRAELPPLSQVYDEDIVRVWDFFSSFGSAFLELGFLSSLPSLDSLQSAIDAIRGKSDLHDSSKAKLTRTDAIDLLTDLSVALSKPLAASLTKFLFSSLIALNPGLQKDYNASFFAELNASSKESSTAKEGDEEKLPPARLPVNKMTWREVARLAFLSDALGEIGFSRQEAAHLLRGYRSGGHPNSKEAKRLRKTEEFSLATLRQIITQGGLGSLSKDGGAAITEKGNFKVRVYVPCSPTASPSDWTFYLHNVKALPNTSPTALMANVSKAVTLLQSPHSKVADMESILSDLIKSLGMFEKVGSSEQLGSSELTTVNKGKQIVLQVLDRVTGETYSTDVLGHVIHRDDIETPGKQSADLAEGNSTKRKSFRQRIGLLDSLVLTKQQYKGSVNTREEYMAEALRLKEDMERKEKQAKGEEDEEDDDEEEDDDDDDGNNEGNKDTKVMESETAKKGSNGDAAASAEIEGVHKDSKQAVSDEKGATEDDKTLVADKAESKTAEPRSSSGGSNSEVVANVVENGKENPAVDSTRDERKIGKVTPFDEFCGDMPEAPELIRRCLAVLRTLCQTGPAEPFIYPVDPQTNPGYYESILRPMCLMEVGKILQNAGKLLTVSNDRPKTSNDDIVERAVAQFGRNVRLIDQNCSCYSNVGASIISAGEEMLRIFERLFLDWVLAPDHLLPPLESLDDDRCVEYHPSDEDSLVLLCDGCEGKYNMSRLDPPLLEVPKGDWYCPRCLSGRCFEDLDPRIGRKVRKHCSSVADGACEMKDVVVLTGVVKRCLFAYSETPGSKASLMYVVRYEDGMEETWTLEEVDKALAETGAPVSPVRCLEAVAESPGYGRGTDHGLHADLVPVPLNPRVADAAAQATLSSSVFRDTIAGSGSLLLLNPNEMTSSEWLRLLILLIMKCSSSEMMLGLASKMESQAAEEMSKRLSLLDEVEVSETLPYFSEDEDEVGSDESTNSRKLQNEVMEDGGEWSDEASRAKKKKTVGNEFEDSALVEDADASAFVVETNAVEVVAEELTGTDDIAAASSSAVVSNDDLKVVADIALSEDDMRKKERSAALSEKENRQKAREDSIAAYCIKNQIRSVVASFEEDAVSQVVDSSLTPKEAGLNFSSCRCRGMVCHFCGLSDTALGSPLLRVPDNQEWNEYMPRAYRSRRMHLIADTRSQHNAAETSPVEESSGVLSASSFFLSPSRARRQKKLVTVSIRVGGEVVSQNEDPAYFDGVIDGGMLEFLPRNEEGFQNEMQFRFDAGLPFISGSWSAHECCAVAAHHARKEHAAEEYKEKRSIAVEKDCGMTCGRTLSLGIDDFGRSYWRFHSDSSTLFVSPGDMAAALSTNKKWYRFSEPEAIASVILSLGKQGVARELKRTFPDAARMMKNGKWSELLQKRVFPLISGASEKLSPSEPLTGNEVANSSKQSFKDGDLANEANDEDEPYMEGEDVLVESKSGKLLWDATVVAVSRSRARNKVNGYRVHYKEWSSRFDEWVEPLRVVEPSENNLQVQEELLEELLASKEDIPESLEGMTAGKFLNRRDRSRGPAELPNFIEVSRVSPGSSPEDQVFATMKAALLLVEAALPLGSVDNSESGPWRSDLAAQWRLIVQDARGPSSLMRCMILMQDALSPEWLDEQVGYLLSCMPIRWKAIGEASTSSLALRIFLIDQGIKYGTVDKQKYASSRRKK